MKEISETLDKSNILGKPMNEENRQDIRFEEILNKITNFFLLANLILYLQFLMLT